ncbi:MAG: GNAT family N-acetyltransferase [Ignavibacteria bacterium]
MKEKYKPIIRGKNCSLIKFKENDERLVDLFHSIFNEKEIAVYLNPDYLNFRTKPKIRKWLNDKQHNAVEVWYFIKYKSRYAGYVCFKWREHYDEACEISTSIEKNYRGMKIGYESSKLLIDYVVSLNKFKYIVAYVFKTNKKAENNLRKIGFKKADRLNRIVTDQFYDLSEEDNEDDNYTLMAIIPKKPRAEK